MSAPYDRSLPLTPDEVERQGFAIEHRGYDRDQVRAFLYEVAAALRLSMQGSRSPLYAPQPPWPPQEPAPPAASPERPTPADPVTDAARILRAAYASATHRQEEADAVADAVVDQARQEAAELVHRAEVEAEEERDRARRVLVAAQEEATALMADAERRARRVLAGARQDALNHAQQVSATLEARANQLIEAEQVILSRLNETRRQLSGLIEELASADPVVGPTIEILQLAVDARTTGEPSMAALPPPPPPPPSSAGPDDGPAGADHHVPAVARMVRAAVSRASTAATGRLPAGETAPEPDEPADRPVDGQVDEPADGPPAGAAGATDPPVHHDAGADRADLNEPDHDGPGHDEHDPLDPGLVETGPVGAGLAEPAPDHPDLDEPASGSGSDVPALDGSDADGRPTIGFAGFVDPGWATDAEQEQEQEQDENPAGAPADGDRRGPAPGIDRRPGLRAGDLRASDEVPDDDLDVILTEIDDIITGLSDDPGLDADRH